MARLAQVSWRCGLTAPDGMFSHEQSHTTYAGGTGGGGDIMSRRHDTP